MFRRRGKRIDMRIDTNGRIHGVERPTILPRLNPERHMILLTFPPEEEVVQRLEQQGFRRGESYVPVVEFFYGPDDVRFLSSYDWIEHHAPVDIRKAENDANADIKEFLPYQKSIEYAFWDVFDNFVFHEGDRIFDYGCGKGSALILFEHIGVRWGGIEYDETLYDCCCRNLAALGLSSETVVRGDAGAFEDIDAYNYFYCYNAFQGETFRRAVHQMEASWQRRPRKITFIYSNPFCHETVLEDGVFHWTETIPAEFYIPEVHVYQTKASR